MNNLNNNNNVVLSTEQLLNVVNVAMEMSKVKSLPIETAIDLFITLKKAEGKRAATIKYYLQLLNYVFDYFKSKKIYDTSGITNETLYDYVQYLFNNNNSNSYVNKLIGAITHMINLLAKHNRISPVKFTWTKMKEKVKEIKILDDNQIFKLANYIPTKEPLQQIALRLFIETGVRRTELINIELNNLDLENNRIYLTHTKNHETRYIFFSDKTKEVISEHISNSKQYQYLFFNRVTQERMTTSFVDSLFAKTKKDLNFENLGPHLLRHTFCTAIARSSKLDMKSIQILMGHKDIQMTLRYISLVRNDDLAKISVANNPLANY